MASIIETFHIDWKIIVAQAVNFGIVLCVIYFFALKPLNKLLAERSEKIAKGINDAKQNAELLAATREEYESVIKKARAEAQSIFQEGRKKAEEKKAEMLEIAKTEVKTMIDSGKKTIEAEKNKMVEEAKKEIVSLVLDASRKVLGNQSEKISDAEIAKEMDLIS